MNNRDRCIAVYAIYLKEGANTAFHNGAKNLFDGDFELSQFIAECAEALYLYVDAPFKQLPEFPGMFEYEMVTELGGVIAAELVRPDVEGFKRVMHRDIHAWFAKSEYECPFVLGAAPADSEEFSATHAWSLAATLQARATSLQTQLDFLERAMKHSLAQLERHRSA
jgi:hypothetical protein